MQYEQAYSFLIYKLERELPSWLTYHNAEHTKNVIAAAEYLAKEEGIAGEELQLLRTAALFHDAGFLENHNKHEEISCKLAKKYLPGYDYNPEQVEAICQMIMATKLPQSPSTELGKYLCDADLFYLSTETYGVTAEKIFAEFKKTGFVKTRNEWLIKQADFLSTHTYFTQTAKRAGDAKKQFTLQEIKSTLKATHSHIHKPSFSENIQDAFFILLGVVIASFALKEFLVPNHFFDGGVTGISLLVHEIYHFNLGLVIVLFNLPLVIISYFSVGKSFAFKTFISVLLLAVCLVLIPNYAVTSDKLLISIFGGVFLGIGIGLVMRAGAALDGIEVLALYTLKKTSFTITEIILGINIVIFTIAAIEVGVTNALYSILTYFAATRSIDYVVEGLQAHTGVTIISAESETIKYELVNKLGRGITVYKGQRGFLPGNFEVSTDCDIIFTVISRLEIRKLKNLVYDVDPKAFVFASTIKEASGGILQRRHKH
ncbi:MAG: YitT family protein [Bacteroidota bacterium]|nr:YitT family protein [Bacteroidota bacterium]